MDIGSLQGGIALILSVALFAIKAFALVDCIGRSASDFDFSSNLRKPAWLVILGLTVAYHALDWSPLALLNLVGIVAALVYLAQVRGSSH